MITGRLAVNGRKPCQAGEYKTVEGGVMGGSAKRGGGGKRGIIRWKRVVRVRGERVQGERLRRLDQGLNHCNFLICNFPTRISPI